MMKTYYCSGRTDWDSCWISKRLANERGYKDDWHGFRDTTERKYDNNGCMCILDSKGKECCKAYTNE